MTERTTFMAFGDLLRDLAQQCRSAERFLRRAEARGMPAGQDAFAGWVADREKHIAASLEQCASEGPENLVQRRLQYMPEHHSWREPDDFSGGLRQLLLVNAAVVNVLREEADKSVSVEVGETLQDLTHQVHAINRGVSMSLVTGEDL
jgi:hypothetical protein